MKLTAVALLAVVLLAGCGGPRTETYADGSTYTGELKDGLRHGQGTMTEANGTKYAGEWKDGFPHGKAWRRLPMAARTPASGRTVNATVPR